MFRMLTFLAILVYGVSLNSCAKLSPKGKKGPKKQEHLIALDTLGHFSRPDQAPEGTLAFSTTAEAECDVSFWPITTDAKVEDEPKAVVNCDQANRLKQSLVLRPLKTEYLYRIQIRTWPVGQSAAKDSFEPFVFEEQQGGYTYFGAKPALEPGYLNEVHVAKVDLPLGTSYVYRHDLGAAAKSEDVAALLERKLGCQELGATANSFLDPADSVEVGGVSTRGFATGTEVRIDSDRERNNLLIEFQKSQQPADQWEWSFRYLNSSHRLSMKPAASLVGAVSIDSADVVLLDRTNFDRGLKEVTVTNGAPLKLSWKGTNLSKYSYLTVQIGHTLLKKATVCTFAADFGVGIIDETHLRNLPTGTHYLTIALEDQRLRLGQDHSQPSWVFVTSDWRAAKLIKP